MAFNKFTNDDLNNFNIHYEFEISENKYVKVEVFKLKNYSDWGGKRVNLYSVLFKDKSSTPTKEIRYRYFQNFQEIADKLNKIIY